MAEPILIGKGEAQQFLLPAYGNRHGLVAGATGTGKTVTLQILAEGFSRLGVPVFLADVKSDLAGLCQAGKPHPKVDERVTKIGITDYQARPYPVTFWDIFGQSGHPVRTTVSEMGPLLLGSLLEVNDTQQGVLDVAFRVADEEGLLLLDFKDLRSLLRYVSQNAAELSEAYGRVSPASVAAIMRRLLSLEDQGANDFFGEPALALADLMRKAEDGRGMINILAADQLIQRPRLYATFLLWLLSELFEDLPEVGDPEQPSLVFFFDEAHLLFDNAPRALLEKVEQVVRLIRSKGVGVYFITQNPLDLPDTVLGQLGNRIQHALRAFTPRDQKAVRAAAQTFRSNPGLDTEQVITQMGVGEALVSTLQAKGIPGMVDRTLIRPPESTMGPVDDAQRRALIKASPMQARYAQAVDRESAFELLQKRAEEAAREAEKAAEKKASAKKSPTKQSRSSRSGGGVLSGVLKVLNSREGQKFLRGILGSFSKGRS